MSKAPGRTGLLFCSQVKLKVPGFGSGREPPPLLLRAANLGSLLVEEGEARQGAEAGKGTQQTGERDAAGGAMVLAQSSSV